MGHEDHQEDPEGPMSRRLATAEPAQPAPSASGILGHESVPPILPRVPVQRLCILPPIGQTHRMISSVPLPKRSWDDSEGHDSAGHIHTPDEPLPGGEHDDSGLPRMQRCPSPTPRRSRNPYGDGWHAEENHLMTEATPQEQSGHERRFPPVDARDGYSGSLEDSEDFGDSYAGPTSMAVLKQVIGFGNVSL